MVYCLLIDFPAFRLAALCLVQISVGVDTYYYYFLVGERPLSFLTISKSMTTCSFDYLTSVKSNPIVFKGT